MVAGQDGSAIHLVVLDVMEQPGAALADGVLVTPTLVKVVGGSRRMIVGRLDSADALERFVFGE